MGNGINRDGEVKRPPRYHCNCRYDKDDEFCNKTALFTRTTDVYRFYVPKQCIKWTAPFAEYSPARFTSEKQLEYVNTKGYRDPDIGHPDFKTISFNKYDKKFNCDRRSHNGLYKFTQFDFGVSVLVPANPVGRTGVVGRGHLGRWGPNHAADPIVTRWKRDEKGRKVYDDDNQPILQFVAIQRKKDNKKWAIPGGMVDPGEAVSKTLIREFAEEALSCDLEFQKETNQVDARNKFEVMLKEFFKNPELIYRGYVDDPRNTDNAWMETQVCNFHDETSETVGKFELKGGDDAEKARWMDLTHPIDLFASHADFLRSVAFARGASRKNI